MTERSLQLIFRSARRHLAGLMPRAPASAIQHELGYPTCMSRGWTHADQAQTVSSIRHVAETPDRVRSGSGCEETTPFDPSEVAIHGFTCAHTVAEHGEDRAGESLCSPADDTRVRESASGH